MSRRGSALFVALVVVLLGAMVTTLATMVAATEIRAGTAWRDQQAAATLATSALARSREGAESLFDSLAAGSSRALDDTVTLMKLGDSVALITATAAFRAGQEVGFVLVRATRDSSGSSRLTASGSRGRFHPIP